MLSSIIMFSVEAASEAVKQGASSGQVITWTAVAMAIVSNIGTWLMILKRASKEKVDAESAAYAINIKGQNPSSESENSPWPIIRLHGETLVRHDTEIKGIVSGMAVGRQENRDAHRQIFDAINRLREEK